MSVLKIKDLYVRCPNLCFSGQEKVHDYNRALYTFKKCTFCNGSGSIKESEFEQINKLI